MTPNTAAAFKENAQTTPDDYQTAKIFLLHPDDPISQDMATKTILAANTPVIVITKDSAHSYAGMMKYVSESFPNIPIIFEDKKGICQADVNDTHCAKHVLKGDFSDQRANAHFGRADVVIVLGQNPDSIHARANPNQQVLSENTIKQSLDKTNEHFMAKSSINIGDIAMNYKQGMYEKAAQWGRWNAQRISPHRCPL